VNTVVGSIIEKAQADTHVLAVVLFGSRARGDQKDGCDTDVCLVLEPSRRALEITELSRKRREYLKDFDLDVQVYQQLPLYIRRRVLKEGKLFSVATRIDCTSLHSAPPGSMSSSGTFTTTISMRWPAANWTGSVF